jgi:hypothetical protein
LVLPLALKPEPLKKVHHSRFALDRTAITFGLAQGGAELFDGFTTRYFVRRCRSCTEADPASRFLLGPRPSWTGMIGFGSLEAVATTYLQQSMRSSSHKFIRHLATIMPIAIIGVHMIEGTSNLITTPTGCTARGRIAAREQCRPVSYPRAFSPSLAVPVGIRPKS